MKSIYVLVTWDDGQPVVTSYTDQHEAIETLKDVLPNRDKAYLYEYSEDGNHRRIQGW